MIMMVIIEIMMMMKINFLSGAQKTSIKEELLPLLGTRQDIGIGRCLKTKKKRRKNCGHKRRPFFVSGDQTQKFFDPKRTTNKDVFCHAIFF